MRFILLGDEAKVLFVEGRKNLTSLRYDKKKEEWVDGGSILLDNRLGFDSSEPIDSPYRFGSFSNMKDETKITKEEAEEFIGKPIDIKAIQARLAAME